MKNEKGFTLVELIIYIAIVSLILVLSSSFAWDIIQGNTKADSFREVQQNARFVMEKVSRSLREGSDPSIFTVTDGILYENEVPLTTEQVEVTEFRITPIENTYRINLTVEYNNISGRNEYEAESVLETTVALFPGGTTSSQGCWGIGGSCDSGCQHTNRGTVLDYYIEPDPLCNRECEPIGRYLVDPSGTCSEDGTGECYKLEDPTTQSTECNQGESCKGDCGGTCTPCREITDERECLQQEGCTLLSGPGGSRCIGRCTPCREFEMDETCAQQLGCTWEASAWYWNLESPLPGYFNYTNCEWYEE